MTNSISPLQPMGLQATSTEPGMSAPPPKPPAASAGSEAATQSEAVTLSPEAQTTTQLLGSARDANGMNQSAVEQIRGALANGSYNVAPEDLANAIVTVLKETNQ